jgi:hypothetical protein
MSVLRLRQKRWQLGESRFAGPGARRAGLPASAPGDAVGAAGVWTIHRGDIAPPAPPPCGSRPHFAVVSPDEVN